MVIYQSHFCSGEHLWRVEITHYDGKPETTVVDDFHLAASPAVIEWGATPWEQALQGSTLTLRVVSPRNYTFLPLYTTSPRECSVVVYMDGSSIFWQGCLDTEFYSEPFDEVDGYEVELTFSDFGALKRSKFNLPKDELYTINDYIKAAAESLGMGVNILERHSIRSTVSTDQAILEYLGCYSSNFYDEDGEPMTWHEVLEGLLAPLGLRLVQTSGTWATYDIARRKDPALASKQIPWSATGQTLSTAKRYKGIKIEFSPYGDAKLAEGSISDDLKMDDCSSYQSSDSFTLEYYHQNAPTKSINEGELTNLINHQVARLTPIRDGEKATFVFAQLPKFGLGNPGPYGLVPYIKDTSFGSSITSTGPSVLFSLSPRNIFVNNTARYIRLELSALFDCRYNPFRDDAFENTRYPSIQENYKKLQLKLKELLIPVRVRLEGVDGKTYYYENELVDGEERPAKWTTNRNFSHIFLSYRNWDGKPKFCKGWMTNKRWSYGATKDNVERWQRWGDGEFIPMPPVGGTIYVDVLRGAKLELPSEYTKTNIAECEWLAFRKLTLTLCDYYGIPLEAEDLSHEVKINDAIEDELSVSTICGSAKDTMPSAKGVYIAKGLPVYNIVEIGAESDTTINVEEHRAKVLAEQYGDRHFELKGEISASPLAMTRIYSEDALEGSPRFLLTAATYNLIDDTADVTLTQI